MLESLDTIFAVDTRERDFVLHESARKYFEKFTVLREDHGLRAWVMSAKPKEVSNHSINFCTE